MPLTASLTPHPLAARPRRRAASALLLCLVPLLGAPAVAQDAPTTQPAPPSVDALLDQLSKLDKAALQEHLNRYQAQIQPLADQAAALRKQADELDAQAAAIRRRVELLKVLLARTDQPPAAENSPAGATPAMAATATPPATMTVVAAADAKPRINYDQHIRPILLEKCAGCHNQDKARSGLIVDSFTDLMTGGAGGKVIQPGDPDGSRLFRLVSHLEEPFMPPQQSKLDDARLALLREWIAQGARATASDEPAAPAAAQPMAVVASTVTLPAGEIPMPRNAPRLPAAQTPVPTPVRALAASPVAPLVAINGAQQLLIYDTHRHELAAALPVENAAIQHAEFSADGRWLLAAGGVPGASGSVQVIDVVTGQRIADVGHMYDAVITAAIDPYRELLAYGGSNRKVRVFDLLAGRNAFELAEHNDWITAVRFSPDATLLATGDRGGGLFVWEAATGRPVHVLRGHGGAINALEFRRDSEWLASASDDGTVRFWEMKNGSQVRSITAHGSALTVAFAPDGRCVTGGADGLIKLWNPDGGPLRDLVPAADAGSANPSTPRSWITRACFMDAGALIAAGDDAGRVALFDAAGGQLVWRCDTNPAPPAVASAQ
ncbi:MAG: hypothetical protein CHACPFDD_00487 [Phycisphaerae bacterium]|nr:hypothetical protein [Phycisphaerae bacterium]